MRGALLGGNPLPSAWLPQPVARPPALPGPDRMRIVSALLFTLFLGGGVGVGFRV